MELNWITRKKKIGKTDCVKSLTDRDIENIIEQKFNYGGRDGAGIKGRYK
ncbi:hypothetical protein GCM10008910_28020 [Faecalicatena orotica]